MREISNKNGNAAHSLGLEWKTMNTLVEQEQDDRISIGYISYVEVQCFAIETILLGLNGQKITVFSLDVEGEVLKVIPKRKTLSYKFICLMDSIMRCLI